MSSMRVSKGLLFIAYTSFLKCSPKAAPWKELARARVEYGFVHAKPVVVGDSERDGGRRQSVPLFYRA